MTQIQPFPVVPLPAATLVLVEGVVLSADPAIFLAMAVEETAGPQEGTGAAEPALPPPVVPGWPLSPPAAVEAQTATRAVEEMSAPEPGAATCEPLAKATLPPLPGKASLVDGPAMDRPPEAEASEPVAPVPMSPPAAALVTLAAAAVPVQPEPRAMAAVPERGEISGPAAIQAEVAVAARPSDRAAPSGPEGRVILPLASQVTESAGTGFAPGMDTVDRTAPMQDAASLPAVAGLQDTPADGELAELPKRTAPVAAPVAPDRLVPPAAPPMKPATGTTGAIIGEAPATEVAIGRGEGRPIVADPPDIPIEGRNLQAPVQPAMAREERLWRLIWPVAGAGLAADTAATAPVVLMPGEGNPVPEATAPAEAAESVEPASSPARAEPPIVVPDRAAQPAPGPANAPAAPLPAMVAPVGDSVPTILRAADVVLPANPAQTPATPPVQVQIMQAVSSGGTVTELRLMPEELGHVRIDMRHEGDRLVMSVSAERQDTLDLLRRHAGELAAELRAAGHSGLDLSFGRWSGPGAEPGGRSAGDPADAPWPAVEAASQQPAPAAESLSCRPASGLYLRI